MKWGDGMGWLFDAWGPKMPPKDVQTTQPKDGHLKGDG